MACHETIGDTAMTDIEKLMECLCPMRHPATCKYWEHHKTLEDCTCGLTEARDLAARVAEWVSDATIRLDERRKWVNELREEIATLRTEIKHLQEVIIHYVDLQSASRLPAEEESALIKNGCKPGCYLTLFETLEQRDIVGTIHASDCPNNEGEG